MAPAHPATTTSPSSAAAPGDVRHGGPASTAPDGRQRVLILGPAMFDMMMDSYRRALTPHYDVRVIDPYAVLGDARKRWLDAKLASQLNRVVATLSRVLSTGEVAAAEPRMLRAAEEFEPDLVLTDCVHVLRPEFIAALRKAAPRAKILGRFGDSMLNLGRGYFFMAEYDRLFFKDHFIVDKFRTKLRLDHVFYLPQSCDRHLHRRIELTDADRKRYGCDIAVYGNGYIYRAETLKPLVGRDVKVWGAGLPRWANHVTAPMFTGHYVAGDEKCRAMLAAKIALNANHYSEIAGTNKRTFELAAIGAFQLTDTPALRDVFVPDEEIATYESAEELLEKIDYYLARPELRSAMAERAAVRAHASHTYEHRWTAMLETLGMRPPREFPVQPEDLSLHASAS